MASISRSAAFASQAATLLGVVLDAPRRDIESAFRRRALRCHPDRHPKAASSDSAALFIPWTSWMWALTELCDKEAKNPDERCILSYCFMNWP